MPRSRSECIADAIAKRIMANSRKRWRSLHADALEETAIMNSKNVTTTGMRVGDNEASRNPVQTTDEASVADQGAKASPANGSVGKNDVTSGMNVSSQVNVGAIKPTDSKTLEGSYAGDHRVTAAPAVLPQNPEPREQMTQAPFGKNTPSNLPVESFPGNLADSDQGN